MSTSSRTPAQQRTAWIGGILAGLAVTAVGYVVLSRTTDGDTAAGFVAGGLAVLALAAIGRWRSVRRSSRAGTAARIGAGAPDERDRRVLESTFAVAGAVALFASSIASVAALMGADPMALLAALPMLLIATIVVTFVVRNRLG